MILMLNMERQNEFMQLLRPRQWNNRQSPCSIHPSMITAQVSAELLHDDTTPSGGTPQLYDAHVATTVTAQCFLSYCNIISLYIYIYILIWVTQWHAALFKEMLFTQQQERLVKNGWSTRLYFQCGVQ